LIAAHPWPRLRQWPTSKNIDNLKGYKQNHKNHECIRHGCTRIDFGGATICLTSRENSPQSISPYRPVRGPVRFKIIRNTFVCARRTAIISCIWLEI
jgi:hypothetical protein